MVKYENRYYSKKNTDKKQNITHQLIRLSCCGKRQAIKMSFEMFWWCQL